MILNNANIIACGDSNTYAFGASDVTHDGAWRFYFGPLISASLRENKNWVGEQPALGGGDSGNKMLGYIGARVDTLLTTYDAVNQFARQKSGLALIMIGHNDCNQIYLGTWAGGSIALSMTNLGTLLDGYRAANPTGVAVIANLFPSSTSGVNDQIVLWNAALVTMVANRSDKAFVLISDVYTAFTNNASWSTDYLWNFLHASGPGHQVIANTLYSTITSNVSFMPRSTAVPKRRIKPNVASLAYRTSTATTFGVTPILDTSLPWAVSFDINFDSAFLTTGSIMGFKNDKSTPFVWYVIGTNERFIEFGASANFSKFFVNIASSHNIFATTSKGWHQIMTIFDGVDRTLSSSYKLIIDGIEMVLTSGSGIGVTTNATTIGGSVATLAAGKFDMADLAIWNGGSAMTTAQAQNWYYNYILPTGPTLTHKYEHAEGSGSTLTDSIGALNGTIGTAAWSTNLPTKTRSISTERNLSAARAVAS